MTMMRDTSAIAEPTAWTDGSRSTPNHWADVRRTVEPDDDPSNPAAVHGIVGTSLSLRRVVRLVEIVAATDAACSSEARRGRQGVDRRPDPHAQRPARSPFVKFNCTPSRRPAESELRPRARRLHRAIARRIGRFELAHGGTLLLDEIGDLPLDLQPKLLRCSRSRSFERVGSAHTIRSDVRVIAATKPSARGASRGGRVSRRPLLPAECVFRSISRPFASGRGHPGFSCATSRRTTPEVSAGASSDSPDVMERLCATVAGNIRELQHAVHRAVILSRGASLQLPPLDAGGG